MGYRCTYEDLDKDANQIIQSHETYKGIDEDQSTPVWCKDASNK